MILRQTAGLLCERMQAGLELILGSMGTTSRAHA